MTLEDILNATSEVTGIPVRAMEGVTKKQEVTDARHLFIQVSRDCEFKVMDIGAAINRSHSSVCCSKRRDEESIKKVKSILSGEVAPVEVEGKPKIRDTGFEIVDVSSKFFGSCFMIMQDDEVIGLEKSYKRAFERIGNREKIVALYDGKYFRSVNTRNLIIGRGDNVDEAMIDFLDSLEEMKESFEVVPRELMMGVKFKY